MVHCRTARYAARMSMLALLRPAGLALLGAVLAPGSSLAEGAVASLRTAQQAGTPTKYGTDAALPGLCMEVLRAVEKLDPGLRFTGLEVKASIRRIERMLANGEIDAFFCLLKSPERVQQWRYLPVPLYKIRHIAVQRADDRALDLQGMQDLIVASHQKPVLVVQGSVLAQTLIRANVITGEAPSEREALQMLLLGRADLVYGQDVNILRHIRDLGLGDRLKVSPTVFFEDTQYATVAKHVSPELEQRLTQALQQLERDGVLKAIADRYR